MELWVNIDPAVPVVVGSRPRRRCPLWNGGLLQLLIQLTAERLTGARQAGHHGSDGNAHHVGQLLVRQALELAAHEQFTKAIWQMAHRLLDQPDVICLQQ